MPANRVRTLDIPTADVEIEPLDIGPFAIGQSLDRRFAVETEQGLLDELHGVASDIVMDAAIIRAGANAPAGTVAYFDPRDADAWEADLFGKLEEAKGIIEKLLALPPKRLHH
jgi:autotransporter translocation and assembly factor TamB